MQIKIGFEFELPIFKNGVPHHVKGASQDELPHDSLACLAEVRSCPHEDIGMAVILFHAEMNSVIEKYANKFLLLKIREHKFKKELLESALENRATKTMEDFSDAYRGGGLHINISATRENSNGKVESVPVNVFEAQGITCILDLELKDMIFGKSNYRKPGQFKMKFNHIYEYRSTAWNGETIRLLQAAHSSVNAFRSVIGK